MSAGSQALERSALEAKDRESLQQIAAAMGGKPAPRAKKADIVDLILELAGVTTKTDAPDAPEASSAEAPADAPATDTPRKRAVSRGRTPRTDDAAEGDDTGAETDRPTNGEGPSEVRIAGDRTRRTSLRGTGGNATLFPDDEVTAERSDRTDTADGGDTDADTDGDPGTGDRSPEGRGAAGQGGDRRPAGDQSGADGSASNGQGAAGTRDEGEAGNRRRRRRGRDRDRPREGQPAPTDRPATDRPPSGQGEDQFVGEPVEVTGLLDLRDEGYGFLRLRGYLPSKDDVYVSVKQVRQFGLRKGDHLKGAARPASRNEKNPALLRIDEVNETDPEVNRTRSRFDELTPLIPDSRIELDNADGGAELTARIIDLVAPIGKGQRGLIVSPPKAGKTTVLKQLARAIEANNPDVHLMVLLVDERPEEVTDMRRAVQGEVVASTFDRPADEHTMVAELVIERSKRLVEEGRDVVIILDGLTRLVRAYNLAPPTAGRVMAGGIDTGALYPAKRFFGAARNVEEGGSLTILATASTETGSALDDAILEEFVGTANMELRLDRRLADLRIYPAIDLAASGSANIEALTAPEVLPAVQAVRRSLATQADAEGAATTFEAFAERLAGSRTNREYLAAVDVTKAGA